MKCPTCGRTVFSLACEACTARRGYEAIRQSQRHYLADAQQGRLQFFAMRETSRHRWHLALFGDRSHAYCGEEILHPGYQNRTHLSWKYVQDRSGDICEKCLAHLKELEEREAIREES